MDVENLRRSLHEFGNLLPHVVQGVSVEASRWKPASGGWSILEVVCHLGDEEEFDFPVRVKRTLQDPDQPWPSIDPEGWAVERRYNDGQLAEAVSRFSKLRTGSLSWLDSLKAPDWTRTHHHPQLGPFRAGDIFAAWVAHDYLHLRQITKRMYELVQHRAGDYSTRYAGEWQA